MLKLIKKFSPITGNDSRFEGLFIQNGRLAYEFTEDEVPIGGGSYSYVFKAKNIIDDKVYAIKKIKIKDNEDFLKKINEIKIWAKLDCDYFVHYRSSWVERYDTKLFENYKNSIQKFNESTVYTEIISDSSDEKTVHILHIQMDLCLFTLNDAINKVMNKFEIKIGKMLNTIGYYIVSELLTELLQSIDYLHKQNPQIIHRDLKPENILISNGSFGRFIKIADFGISTLHGNDESHTRFKGTQKYMAPEVMDSKLTKNGKLKYDTKADIFSLGVIILKMFNLDINNADFSDNMDSTLKNKYQAIIKTIHETLSPNTKERPDCDQILNDRNLWSFNLKDIDIQKEMPNTNLNEVYDPNNEFVLYFLKLKSNY